MRRFLLMFCLKKKLRDLRLKLSLLNLEKMITSIQEQNGTQRIQSGNTI
ncbi:MAG: hypothetical protein GY714_10520 [Desulfobacterales bacterium]|nr:hypothetical protein [Desulfobacterales bacterium]